jgi:hypothetical protein
VCDIEREREGLKVIKGIKNGGGDGKWREKEVVT